MQLNAVFGPRLFLLEPLRPLASTIVEDAESLQAPAVRSTVYAFALLLLFSSLFLSLMAPGACAARLSAVTSCSAPSALPRPRGVRT